MRGVAHNAATAVARAGNGSWYSEEGSRVGVAALSSEKPGHSLVNSFRAESGPRGRVGTDLARFEARPWGAALRRLTPHPPPPTPSRSSHAHAQPGESKRICAGTPSRSKYSFRVLIGSRR